jgi:16S rRNA (cytosine1402-N4)-methyltransferase
MEYAHIPVMPDEAMDYVGLKQGGRYIDCTLGGGGYTSRLSEAAGKDGLVVSFDLDARAIDNFSANKPDNVRLINDSFANLRDRVVEVFGPEALFDGIVMDLGLSSAQIDDPERGFSFKFDSSLDMSFSGSSKTTSDIVNYYNKERLAQVISEYGEEKFARQIAEKIVQARRDKSLDTAKELAEIVVSAIPERFRHGRIHPATKTFQALRMETNGEMDALKKVLPQAVSLLKKGGRLVVVSFHSLEDSIVKNFFRQESRDCLCPPSLPLCRCGHRASLSVITKKPVLPKEGEVELNQRSRSAKLRAAEKV